MFVHGEGELPARAHADIAGHVLDRLEAAEPRAVCLKSCETSEELTCGALAQQAARVAAALAQLGAARGATVALAGEHRLAFLPTALGVMLTGATLSPIAMPKDRDELAHKLNLTKTKFVICSRLLWLSYGDLIKSLDFIKTLISFEEMDDIELSVEAIVSRHDLKSLELPAVRGDDVATVTFSSGTTGRSKGVQVTRDGFYARFQIFQQYMRDWESFQIFGFNTDFTTCHSLVAMFSLICAGKIVLYSDDREKWPALVQDFQVEVSFCLPKFIEDVIRDETKVYNLNSVKVLQSSGAPLLPRSAVAFRERYPQVKLWDVYGSAESFFIATTHNLVAPQDPNAGIWSVGVVVPGVTVKVVDVKTREILGPNERGEICVRSPAQMKGYLGDGGSCLDEQGFYRTGDLGYYNEHKHLYTLDRLTDVIYYAGHQVSPREVEAVLLRHAAVREAAVLGAPGGAGAGAGASTQLVACVVLRKGAAATEPELLRHVASQVPWYMQLRGGVRFLPELPRNSRMKILRRELMDMLANE